MKTKARVLETLARLEQEMARQGRIEEEQDLREAVSALARSSGLITTGQAAERLDISIPTVKRWIDRGTLAGVDTGTRRLVSEESVVRLLRIRQNLADLDSEGNPSLEEIQRSRSRRKADSKERVA